MIGYLLNLNMIGIDLERIEALLNTDVVYASWEAQLQESSDMLLEIILWRNARS